MGKLVGPWFVQMVSKNFRVENSVKIVMYHLRSSLLLTGRRHDGDRRFIKWTRF